MVRTLDVLCVGHASYDHVFSVDHHPGPDEKLFAGGMIGCGGGPAANAAVTVARLGHRAGFMGYLGKDLHGALHVEELLNEKVDTTAIIRGDQPTPVSVILVKPDGTRSVTTFKGTSPSTSAQGAVTKRAPRVILMDGHEPDLSMAMMDGAAVTVLDAGSLHHGTEALMRRVDYLVCSEKFATSIVGRGEPEDALRTLGEVAPTVVITLGERGLLWQHEGMKGRLSAFTIRARDTTGAGDAFHGAFAAGLVRGLSWPDLLLFASAAGAACCEVLGARPGLPDDALIARILQKESPLFSLG
jgi:sulfofructose kinase